MPNLTALLAMLLAERDVRVLVHGHLRDPKRVTTAEIFRDLGLDLRQRARDEIDDGLEPAASRRSSASPRSARRWPA